MSGLAALLAGHNRPDIYRWQNASHPSDIQHAVEHAGWRFAYLDAWTVEDKPSLLKAVSAALDLPEPVADSFDALSDSLADVSAGDAEGLVLLWDGWAPMARADERVFSVALSVFGGRVNAERGGKFVVLLRGDGPTIDVPELVANPG